MIKCVVWDIDNTLLRGTFLESGEHPPPADDGLVGVARELDGRGIVHALASRNPPAAADYAAAVTGLPFAAAECGWDAKSAAVRRIMDDLGLAADAVAFVDDDLLERAEVAAGLPGILVLSPEDAAEAPGWPQFRPPVLTDEGRRRGELYARRRSREQAARAWGGSRDDFLRGAGTRLRIAPPAPADLPRLHELSVRTHQFNTAADPVSEAALAAMLASSGRRLLAAWLRDDYADDGLVGAAAAGPSRATPAAAGPSRATPAAAGPSRAAPAAPAPPATPVPPVTPATPATQAPSATSAPLVAHASRLSHAVPAAGGAWEVPFLVMSCRALGRGVLDALLAALCRAAAAGGAAELVIPCLVTDRNVPLRLALASAGFRAPGIVPPAAVPPEAVRPETGPGAAVPPGEPVRFARPLAGPLPPLPDWADLMGA